MNNAGDRYCRKSNQERTKWKLVDIENGMYVYGMESREFKSRFDENSMEVRLEFWLLIESPIGDQKVI